MQSGAQDVCGPAGAGPYRKIRTRRSASLPYLRNRWIISSVEVRLVRLIGGSTMQASVTRTKSNLEKAQTRAGYLFILPCFALYAVFVLAPVIVTFVLSFTYYDPMAGSRWVGLENFQRFFTGDRSLQIFWNTLCFAIFAVTGNVIVGLLLALALHRAMPAFLLYLFRLAYFLPVIIAAAFVSIVWGYFYGDDLGVINYYLIRLGFAPVHWLTSSHTAMMSIIIMDIWKNAGFFMIIFIAPLQGLPKPIMVAATLDDA